MIAKRHKSIEGKIIIAICDDDLLGKKFEKGKLQLDLTSSFYNGEKTTEAELEEIIKNANALNVVGKESVAFCEKRGLVDKDRVIKIAGIPHIQIVIVKES